MKNKLWTVYQIENRVNSRLYIGVHNTVDPNDDYMGSGKVIKRAIQKHGIENFKKIILLATEDRAKAFALEKQLVTLDRIESGELYNLKEGGEGGWDFVHDAQRILRAENPEWAKRESDRKRENAIRLKLSLNLPKGVWKGKKHSLETIIKMKKSHIGIQSGSKNSRFGSVWVTNGTESKSLPKDQAEVLMDQGWVRGRKWSRKSTGGDETNQVADRTA